MRVKNCRETVGRQFLPRDINLSRRALWVPIPIPICNYFRLISLPMPIPAPFPAPPTESFGSKKFTDATFFLSLFWASYRYRYRYHYSGEPHRPLTLLLLKNIAIHLPFLSRYFCTSMPSSWQKVVHTPTIYITIRLPFVSRCFCRSIRVRVVGTPLNHRSEIVWN